MTFCARSAKNASSLSTGPRSQEKKEASNQSPEMLLWEDRISPRSSSVTGCKAGKQEVSKRFGSGEGIIGNTEEFDSFNDEIAELFDSSG